MNEQNDIAEKHWFSNKQVISLLVGVAMITFTLTGIFFEFEYLKGKLISVVELIEYNNDRSDKKDARIQDDVDNNTASIKQLRNEVNQLHEPGSDTNKK